MTIDELGVKVGAGGYHTLWGVYKKDLEALVRTERERCANHACQWLRERNYLLSSTLEHLHDSLLDVRLATSSEKPPTVREELVAALKTCESAIGGIGKHLSHQPWARLAAARHLARRAIERDEKEKGET